MQLARRHQNGSALRQKLINHMTLRNYSECTVHSYLDAVLGLVKYYNLSPEKISDEMIEQYFLHRRNKENISWNTLHLSMYGIRYLYKEILGKEIKLSMPTGRKKRRRLPEPLSKEEVQQLLEATTNSKHKTILMTLYGTGLRAAELSRLLPRHIQRDRRLIRVDQGKGKKDRYTILPNTLLEQLSSYYRAYRPTKWLFPGPDPNKPISVRTIEAIFRKAKKRAGISHGHGPHSLRHSFATHVIEMGGDISLVKELLGHRAIRTTMCYCHVSPGRGSPCPSPLDALYSSEEA